MFRATRYAPDYQAFDGRDMTPGALIESNPLPSDCEIFDDPIVALQGEDQLQGVYIYGNLISSTLRFENTQSDNLRLSIFNSLGRLEYSKKVKKGIDEINLTELPPGVYIAHFLDVIDNSFISFRILKS